MRFFASKRLSCFYCGTSADRVFDGSFRLFRCRACDADNHLDEKGEITDPPVQIPADESPKKLTTRFSRGSSHQPVSPLEEHSGVVFCSTCQRNQHLLRAALSSYLPDISHPQYREYEASYPEYHRVLEQRYPQSCAECQPKVNEHIRKVEYAAQSILLKDAILKSKSARSRGRHPPSWALLRLAVIAAGVVWGVSVASQAAWHLSAFAVDWAGGHSGSKISLADGDINAWLSAIQECGVKGISQLADPACFDLLGRAAMLGLAGAGLTVWWSPVLLTRLARPRLRLSQVGQHVLLQGLMCAIRAALLWVLQSPNRPGWTVPLFQGAHGFGLVLMAVNIYQVTTTMQATRQNSSLLQQQRERQQKQQMDQTAEASSSSVAWDPLSLSQTPRFKANHRLPTTPFPISSLAASLPTDDLLKSSRYEQSDSDQSSSGRSRANSDAAVDPDRMEEDEDSTNLDLPQFRSRFGSAQPFGQRASPFSTPRPFGVPDQLATPQRPAEVQFTPSRFQSRFGAGPGTPMTRTPLIPRQMNRQIQQPATQPAPSTGDPFNFDSAFSIASPGVKMEMMEPKLKLGNSGTGLEGLFDSAFSFKESPDAQARQRPSPRSPVVKGRPTPGRQQPSQRHRASRSRTDETTEDEAGYYSARSVNRVVLVVALLAILLGVSGWVMSLAGRAQVVWVMHPPAQTTADQPVDVAGAAG